MSNIVDRARQLRAQIEIMAVDYLPDETAIDYIELFPLWDPTAEYAFNDRCRYMGKLYRCITAHTAQELWNPVDAVALWAEVLPGQDGTDIGPWVQPGANNGYKYGDKVIHNGHIWQSNFDPEGVTGGNVWEPGAIGVYTWDDLGPIE